MTGRRELLLGLGLVLVAAALLSCSSGGRHLERAPEFLLKTAEGQEISSRACEGKVCLLAIWASWCAPCQQKMPELNGIASEFGDQLQVVGISVDEDLGALGDYLSRHELRYPVALADQEFLDSIEFTGILPTVVFVGRDGMVLSRYMGTRTEEFLRGEVRRLLATQAAHLQPATTGLGGS